MKKEIGKTIITLKIQKGLSSGNYYHIPLIYLGFGRNGFGITLFCVFFGISFNKNKPNSNNH